jgi:hypothetical protein
VHSYDASLFSIFENERLRRAHSPNIENKDASEACLVHMLCELATLVASHALYVAEEYRSFRAPCRKSVSACRRAPDRMASMQRNSTDQNVHTVYVRISCICRILSYVSILIPTSKDGRKICEYEHSRTL